MAFFKNCPKKMEIRFLCVVDSASSLIHITDFVHHISFQAFKITDELRKINVNKLQWYSEIPFKVLLGRELSNTGNLTMTWDH
jgi:hypothetical protein